MWCRSFQELNRKPGNAVLKNKLQNQYLYSAIIRYFELDSLGINKFDSAIKNLFTENWSREGTSSFVFLGITFRNLTYFHHIRASVWRELHVSQNIYDSRLLRR